jgi:diguanylate cyclase (GGDEF)-like protein
VDAPKVMLVAADASVDAMCSEAAARFPEVPLACLQDPDSAVRHEDVFEYIAPSPGLSELPDELRAVCHRWARIGALKETARILQQVETTAELAYFEFDAETEQVRWSESLTNLLGLDAPSSSPALSQFLTFVHPDDNEPLELALRRALAEGIPLSIDFRIVGPLGEIKYMHARGTPAARTSSSRKLFCVVEDVSRFQDRVDRAEMLSLSDPLTGLGNRRFLTSRGPSLIEAAKRAGTRVALLYIDLDRFKIVNDTLGHDAGDAILTTTAARLVDTLRATDLVCRDPSGTGGDPVISRLGGDEFTVLIPDLASTDDASLVAQRLRATLSQPIVLGPHTLSMSSSIGVASFPEDGESVDELVRRADRALYHVKRSRGGGCQAYSPALEIRSRRRLLLEMRLRKALEEGLLDMHFQPRVRFPEQSIVGLEALLRWNDSELGAIPPIETVAIAEEAGLIAELGRWTLHTSCRRLREILDSRPLDLLLSVNVSALQLEHSDLYDTVVEALRTYDIPPDRLELDITESALAREGEQVERCLHELRAIGVRIALDDFGIGQSSLQSLTRFPIDTLKVDREFIREFDPEGVAGKLVVGVLGIAHEIGLHTVAEGVTTMDQATFLVTNKCREMQGHLFAPPLPGDQIANLLSFSRFNGPRES